MKKTTTTTLILTSFCFMANLAFADMAVFPTEENYPNSILELEDLIAQCRSSDQRAVFTYQKNIKLLSWYRSESYSPDEERKLNLLAAGIERVETGWPKFPGYLDIRKNTLGDPRSPYSFTKDKFPEFGWIYQPIPHYRSQDCKKSSQRILMSIIGSERKVPKPSKELEKFINATDPGRALDLSKRIGSCIKYGFKNKPPFITSTSYEAWVSNRFSRSYGDSETLPRPLLQQLQRELSALGGMAAAATEIDFGVATQQECRGLKTELRQYSIDHPAL